MLHHGQQQQYKLQQKLAETVDLCMQIVVVLLTMLYRNFDRMVVWLLSPHDDMLLVESEKQVSLPLVSGPTPLLRPAPIIETAIQSRDIHRRTVARICGTQACPLRVIARLLAPVWQPRRQVADLGIVPACSWGIPWRTLTRAKPRALRSSGYCQVMTSNIAVHRSWVWMLCCELSRWVTHSGRDEPPVHDS